MCDRGAKLGCVGVCHRSTICFHIGRRRYEGNKAVAT